MMELKDADFEVLLNAMRKIDDALRTIRVFDNNGVILTEKQQRRVEELLTSMGNQTEVTA